MSIGIGEFYFTSASASSLLWATARLANRHGLNRANALFRNLNCPGGDKVFYFSNFSVPRNHPNRQIFKRLRLPGMF
jgi:hypothetical protein